MITDRLFWLFSSLVVGGPIALFAFLGCFALAGRRLGERTVARWTQAAVVVGLTASLAILALMFVVDTRVVRLDLGDWFVLDDEHFHFHVMFLFDRLSIPFVILAFVLCGTVGAFARSYLHKESGYARFFLLFAMFLLGMIVSSLAGTIETLFTGWELVGLSSALLVGFFQERANPVRNGLRVWSVYRIADAAFLIAAVTLHHLTGEGNFAGLLGGESWPDGHATLSPNQTLAIGSLLLVAAAGKSALVPFSGWLPRAMEGPTPSSAVFYGALSVHLGAFLLLRVSPILDLSALLCAAVVVVGLVTAVFAVMAGRVQTDIKSALAYASLTQVGLIVAEIGLGLRYIALIHIIGHACLRTLQLLRAPTLLHDYHTLENAIGDHLHSSSTRSLLPMPVRSWLYRLSLERGYFDGFLAEYIVHPFRRCLEACDRMERRWTDWLSGSASRESDRVRAIHDAGDELL